MEEEKMNILYVGGESSNWSVNLCNKFCEKGNKVTCVVQNSDCYEKVIPHKNLTLIELSYNEFININIVKSKLLFKLNTEKYDVLFGSHVNSIQVVHELAKLLRIPWGMMILDIPSDLINNDRKRFLQWTYYFDLLKYANTIIFNTKVARDEYFKFTNQYFDGFNVITYSPNLPKEYKNSGISIKGDYVISICRLTPQKNCKIIPFSLGLLEKPPKYVCIGRDGGELEIIKAICERNNVEFVHKENVSEKEKFELIKNSLCLIYPQTSEYIGGLSPFEALWCGKQVICPDIKILKDLYSDVYVHYYKQKDDVIRELAKQISFVKESKPNEFLLKDSSAMIETISFDVMAFRMIEVFKKMIL